ncbi:MAG: hypothetical protein JO212_01535 [Acetobacteraceae bacterium]|nr:hypothetical protein [Acetobacteraceae bacterium]
MLTTWSAVPSPAGAQIASGEIDPAAAASYVTVRRQYSQTFDTFDIVTGEGADTVIDAIATIANGTLVTDIDTLEELAQNSDYLDVQFIFVQAERSSSFAAAKIGSFHFGVQDFFRTDPAFPRNEDSECSEIAIR